MIGRVALALVAPLAAQAQLALFAFDGITETPVGATYDYGKVSAGDFKDVRFRARNTGDSAVLVKTLPVSGAGFAVSAVNGSLPYTIAPSFFLEFTVRLSTAAPATYSAALQVNTINVILLGTAVPAPTLTVFPACTVDAGTGAINFGNIPNQTLRLCNFLLQNLNSQPLVITTLKATGVFQGPQNLPTPFTLAPQQAVSFTIQVTPACGTNSLSGTLSVNTKNYTLAGTSFIPALPKPVLTFDSTTIASGQQHTLTMSLPRHHRVGPTVPSA